MNQKDENKVSLHAFLEQHHVLLSSVGVMTGLASFLGVVPSTLQKPFVLWPVIIIYIFSLLMMCGAMVVWYETLAKFPKHPELRLRIFKYILSVAFWVVVLFLLLAFRNLSRIFVQVGIFFMVAIPITHRITGLRKIHKDVVVLRKTKRGKVFLSLFVLILTLSITYLVVFISNNINNTLDFLSKIVVK